MTTLQQRAQRIKLVAFDVDGIFTDGSLYFGGAGPEIKAFNVRDGHGVKQLQQAGLITAIITGRHSDAVTQRARDLGIDHVFQGQHRKLDAFHQLLTQLQLTPEQTAYMGDDVIDLPILRRCGLAITVADAYPLVKEHVHWITTATGGHGAVREAAECILTARNQLAGLMAEYLA
jgi:3-deoxy-D-manno-octulosonate 8-phosphate phosphatase (KDO 8-P phosphatase)